MICRSTHGVCAEVPDGEAQVEMLCVEVAVEGTVEGDEEVVDGGEVGDFEDEGGVEEGCCFVISGT